MKWLRLCVMLSLVALGGCLLTGCSLTDSHIKQMDMLNSMALRAAQALDNGAITSVHVSGQGLEPGVAVEASIICRATAYYKGMAGQFSTVQTGESGPLDPGQQSASQPGE
ncbi:MAG: hypothetical protein FWC56_06085 [Phycisphaerae bacterium]|nr:hypothetical protein [Phycisphaerae bacterium]